MDRNQTSFSERIERIERSNQGGFFRRRRPARAEGIVFHSDGVVTRKARSQDRLRFGFPLRGLAVALLLTVIVKAYMIWALGAEVYGAAVAELLSGSQLERAAGLILAPDTLTLWALDAFQTVYRFFGSMMTALGDMAMSGLAA